MQVPSSYLLCFVFAFICFMSIGAYGQTSVNNCNSSATIEATLTVDGAAHNGSFGNAGGLEYFRIAPASDVNVKIETADITDGFLQLCDSSDDLIASSTDNIPARLRPGTYYIVVGSRGAASYELTVETDAFYNALLSNCENITTNFNDPLYGCQWHLKITGPLPFVGMTINAGEDINIEGVWNDGISGRGVNVAVVDSGMDPLHEDLAANVNSRLNHDYSGNSNVFDPSDEHGTLVAGIIAAVGDNRIGIRGVAPQASIYSYNLIGGSNFSDANKADAMTRNRTTTAVSNNSWGAADIAIFHPAERTWEMAVETGIREGFGGKGVFYSWAAGNGGDEVGQGWADQANFEEYSNYYAVTSVCSVDGDGTKSSFSEEGVNLWVCAPGQFITTTYNKDRYHFGGGTSFSAPVVSGVAALMREVNGDLSWRDLKLILAASARKNDPNELGWETGAVKYGPDTDRYNYNPKYGFGVVDAEAAVELARSWTTVPQMRTLPASSGNINTAIPDAVGEITSILTIPDTDLFTEFVEINLNFSHEFFPNLNIQITSPDGTVSELTEEYVDGALSLIATTSLTRNDFGDRLYTHRFGSAKHLGEDPAGEWTLNISDTVSDDTGTLHSWSIKVYGHRKGDTGSTGPNHTRPDTGEGGGGGCSVSDQSDVVSGLFGVMACLMLIPVSVVIRRKRRPQMKCSYAVLPNP